MNDIHAPYMGCLKIEYTPVVHNFPSLKYLSIVNAGIKKIGIPKMIRVMPSTIFTDLDIIVNVSAGK
jgi:hypothetical protein